MEANRTEAQRCREIAREAIRDKDIARANKFLEKAVRLDPAIDIKGCYFLYSFFCTEGGWLVI